MSNLSMVENQFSNKLIYSIGLLFVTAASAEHALALQMARLIAHPRKIDPATVAALSGTETKVRIQQIQILARLRLGVADAEKVIRACDKLRDSFEHRNSLAHWHISPGASRDKAVLKNTKLDANGRLQRDKPFTDDQIREFTEQLHERIRKFDELLTSAGIRTLAEPAQQDHAKQTRK